MKKFILICMMITIPLLLMLGIFNIGKNLEAAHPIDGIWHVSGTEPTQEIADCKLIDLITNDSNFSIQQSGKFIYLRFEQESIPLLKGELSGVQLALTNHTLKLSGTINIDSIPNRMQAEIFFSDCQQAYQFAAEKNELSVSLSESE